MNSLTKTNAYIKLEQKINLGSLTGLSFINSTSLLTHPMAGPGSFMLPCISSEVHFYSNNCNKRIIHNYDFPIHPDIFPNCKKSVTEAILNGNQRLSFIEVYPTASPRTVFAKNSNRFLKLDYPNILGRFSSFLSYEKCVFSIYVSQAIEEKCDLSFFSEDNFLVCKDIYYGKYKDSFLINRSWPSNFNHEEEFYIPGHSVFLFSELKLLLEGINFYIDLNSVDSILKNFCYPVIDDFNHFLLNGFIPEAHPQNFGFIIKKDAQIRTAWKDAQGFYVERKIDIQSNYHQLESQEEIQKIRSFAFDWIFSYYYIDQLIKHVSKFIGLDDSIIFSKIKDYIMNTDIPRLINFKDGFYRMDLKIPQEGERLSITYSNQNPYLR